MHYVVWQLKTNAAWDGAMRTSRMWVRTGLLGLMVVTALHATAENKQEADPALIARLKQVDAESSLEDAALKPWHLKLSIQLFDEKGQPKEQGAIEEWWSSPSLYKITYSSPSYNSTEIRNAEGFYRTNGTDAPLEILKDLRLQMVHPMPSASVIDNSVPLLKKQKMGTVDLDCIYLYGHSVNPAMSSSVMAHASCVNTGTTSLRVTNYLDTMTIRNRMGRFQGKETGIDAIITSDKFKVGTAHVKTLETMDELTAFFAPSPDMQRAPDPPIGVPSSVIAGHLLTQQPPHYPPLAKMAHTSGTVIMRATIGKDGHVHNLRAILNPDPSLAASALEAVKQWTYKPYLLNGEPTEVDTVISVNFAMR